MPGAAPARGATPITRLGQLAALWGLCGYTLLIVTAVLRLWPYVVELFAKSSLEIHHTVALVAWVGFMLYSEAYRGFHLAFAPRFAVRAAHLARQPTVLRALLAPAFCMGLLFATRKRLIVSWLLVVAIVGLVLGVRMLAQPWRGIVDVGVVLGLAAGSGSVLWFFGRALTGTAIPMAPDLPAGG